MIGEVISAELEAGNILSAVTTDLVTSNAKGVPLISVTTLALLNIGVQAARNLVSLLTCKNEKTKVDKQECYEDHVIGLAMDIITLALIKQLTDVSTKITDIIPRFKYPTDFSPVFTSETEADIFFANYGTYDVGYAKLVESNPSLYAAVSLAMNKMATFKPNAYRNKYWLAKTKGESKELVKELSNITYEEQNSNEATPMEQVQFDEKSSLFRNNYVKISDCIYKEDQKSGEGDYDYYDSLMETCIPKRNEIDTNLGSLSAEYFVDAGLESMEDATRKAN